MFNTYLIYYLSCCLVFALYTLLYIEKEQKQAGRRRANGQTGKRERTRAAPRRSAILPAASPSSPSGGEEGKSKGASRTGRERTRARNAADLFARSSPPFLFCLLPPPSAPSPAAHPHHVAPATRTRGRAATSSASGRCHRHTSPPIDSDQQRQGSASGCRSSCPPRPRPLPLCQVVRVGRSPPAHPVDPLHPAGGAVRIVPDGSRQGGRGQNTSVEAQSSLRIKILRIDRTNVSL